MGFKYLKGDCWKDISRDERRFCIDLLWQLKKNDTEKEFVKWILEKPKLKNIDFGDFEIAIEVCYYRDLIFQYERKKKKRFANKEAIKGFLTRTFDICIFLPKDIIIIEAKAAEGLTRKQMAEFNKDKEAVNICHENLKLLPPPEVHFVGLFSEEYYPHALKLNESQAELFHFDEIISWDQISSVAKCRYEMPEKLRSIYSETRNNNKSEIDTDRDRESNPIIEELRAICLNPPSS